MQTRPLAIQPEEDPPRRPLSPVELETNMPKYYVRLEPDGPAAKASEDLLNDDAAARLVDAIAGDLTRTKLSSPYQRVIITNERGDTICERMLVSH